MSKLTVKMATNKPGTISKDMADYLRRNPALAAEIEKQTKYEKQLQTDQQDHSKWVLKLIHNHTHKVKDITDLPEYIKSLNVMSVPAAHELVIKHVVPILHHINKLSSEHNKASKDYSSKFDGKVGEVAGSLKEFRERFDKLKLAPDLTETVANIVERIESREKEFNPIEFEAQLLKKLTEQLKGSTKVIQIHSGGGLAAMPLNRIPGVNITNPQNGDVLTYQSSTKTWVNSVGGAGGTYYTWEEITAVSKQAQINYAYVTNNNSRIEITLPVDTQLGDRVRVAGKGSGGWAVVQNSGQIIHFGNRDSTAGVTGGLLSGNRYDSIELVCIEPDTEFLVITSVGNIGII